MQENQNINLIEEISDKDDSIIEMQDEKENNAIVNENTTTNIPSNVSNDYIKEFPTWDINPPIEVNRGE